MQDDERLSEGGAQKMDLREEPSVDQFGNPDGSGTTGMGWFPGYAISLETGERLNMAFGEDSWLANDNGSDMMWNPTSNYTSESGLNTTFGGKHYIYIFRNQASTFGSSWMPGYDGGVYIEDHLDAGSSTTEKRFVWRSCMWVAMPMLVEGEELLSTDVRIRIRITKKYDKYTTASTLDNTAFPDQTTANDYPIYEFSTSGLATVTADAQTATDALELINAVPNPYYAYSNYEETRLENTVKIVNLPETCTIRIYNVNGTLVRSFDKDDPMTSVDWDLKNQKDIPIAGGLYIIHVETPTGEEAIVKWFGALRPPDLDGF
jgi:hypothetical protein